MNLKISKNRKDLFGIAFFNGKIIIHEADRKQSNLVENILEFSNKARPRAKADNTKKLIHF